MSGLVRLNLDDKLSAIALFKTIINRGTGYREAMLIVAEQPQAALVALQSIQAELTPQGAAKILEEVISNATDTATAAQLVGDHLSMARQVELLAARSDLDSLAAEIVNIDVVLQAIRRDLGDNAKIEEEDADKKNEAEENVETDRTNLLRTAYVARSWARKLRDRVDYQEILDAHMVGDFTFRECLLIGLANETLYERRLRNEEKADEPDLPMDQSMFGGLTDEDRLIPDEALEALGLDPDEALGQLRDLLENKRMLRFRQQEIEAVRTEREEKRAQQATAEAARDAATQAAEKVDF